MSVLLAALGIILGFAAILIPRLLYWHFFERKRPIDRYWSLDWEKPDENITEICHRLRIPPPPPL